jgi:hypothetical protein
MTEPRDASPDRATGDSGVPGSRRDAGVPSGSTTPDEIGVGDPEGDPTTSNLSELVSDGPAPTRPTETEPVTDSGRTDPYSPTGTGDDTGRG